MSYAGPAFLESFCQGREIKIFDRVSRLCVRNDPALTMDQLNQFRKLKAINLSGKYAQELPHQFAKMDWKLDVNAPTVYSGEKGWVRE